jgi:hypothetical protein
MRTYSWGKRSEETLSETSKGELAAVESNGELTEKECVPKEETL